MVEDLKPILQDPEVKGSRRGFLSSLPLFPCEGDLLADKDVLVEKPMALNTKDAEEMLGIWRRRGKEF